MVYVVLYIHTDEPTYSETLGVFQHKADAVTELLERANYRELEGRLTQYMIPCNEYKSFTALREKVEYDMKLVDGDIYRIEELPLK
jgi:hypothetical protein